MAFPAWMSGFCPAMFRATFDCRGSSDTVRFFTTMVGLRLASIGFFSGGRLAKISGINCLWEIFPFQIC
ncbi:myb-like transcription factor family protein [Arabidopsis thaliana]|uniref:Myb-like transcription factor family protein n=1 Tax=Arabidopsis thaliana TaxID=3702 RepID=Q682N6_ARATH|nr:myb-like transcription factor family protein [Arabidopsis thaliana]AEE31804.1 myb-like transcription factor family protein [Arabidopsis thaliana]BAD43013.1 unnamed protein product [Arabidopsis thaliana]BAD43094.1 unnamed protein product [Arabidopsis thaliana]BAD43616.1 unnamed protein product [Arabidopsis thaliana]BAD43818.1 unnamed protein product [Arabidopsis thaliana]|eukprot:NP_001077667.1 myb-like transcription factor family protein [Arabidopsis thaliana]